MTPCISYHQSLIEVSAHIIPFYAASSYIVQNSLKHIRWCVWQKDEETWEITKRERRLLHGGIERLIASVTHENHFLYRRESGKGISFHQWDNFCLSCTSSCLMINWSDYICVGSYIVWWSICILYITVILDLSSELVTIQDIFLFIIQKTKRQYNISKFTWVLIFM